MTSIYKSLRLTRAVFLFVIAIASPSVFATGGGGVYIGDFVGGQPASAQAQQQWDDFRSSLAPASYDTVTISGTFDAVGRTLHDAVIVPLIAQALKNGSDASYSAGGGTWNVGTCGSGIELNANDIGDTDVCSCAEVGYVVRPAIGNNNVNWGGANTAICVGPTQRLIVVFTGPTLFKIQSLTTDNATAVDAVNEIGDDRGGIAVSASRVFLNGDTAVGVYDRANLAGPTTRPTLDGLVMNLHSQKVYTLAFNGTPAPAANPPGTFVVNQLIELNPATGALTGSVINLSATISLASDATDSPGECGVFAGYDRIVLVDSPNTTGAVYNIELPSGLVSNVGTVTDANYINRQNAEDWATYGVAEFFDDGLSLIFFPTGSASVGRLNVNTNTFATAFSFGPFNSADAHELTVVPTLSRWYLHYEGGDSDTFPPGADTRGETLAFADATFLIRGRVLYAADGANSNADCHLFALNPATGGVLSDVGPIGFDVTGLALDPSTGVLYGATGLQDPNSPNSIITVNPATGAGTLVGPEIAGGPLADIAFTSDRVLYGWGEGTDNLYTVDPSTGQATIVGLSGLDTAGSGISPNSLDVLYFAGADANGLLRTIDRNTGTQASAIQMSGAPFGTRVPALAFNAGDLLFGADGGGGHNIVRHLTTIDTVSGLVTDVGPTIDGLDALVFVPAPQCDGNPPVITAPNDISVRPRNKKKHGRRGARVDFQTSAHDPEDGAVTATAVPPSGSFFRVGATKVTVTATDSCGNISTETFKVTVKKSRRHGG